MPRRLIPDDGNPTERASAFRELYSGPIFSEADLVALAEAARVERTPAFDRTIRAAVLLYVGNHEWRRRARRQNWKPSLVADHLRAVSDAALKLAMLLSQLPPGGRLAIEHGARQVQEADILSGRLIQTADRTPRVTVATSSARCIGYPMDMTGFLLNPSDPYPVDCLSRAAEFATGGPLAHERIDPLTAVSEFLAAQLALPLSATVSVDSDNTVAGKTGGRLVDLVVLLTRLSASLNLPGLGLPAPIAVGADAVKKAIYERAKDPGT